MAKKKNVKLSVPLMPKSKKKGVFNANFTDIVVGKLTVKREDKYPGTIRFENDVPLRTEALIEEAVLESLSKISNQSSTTGYVVTPSICCLVTTSVRPRAIVHCRVGLTVSFWSSLSSPVFLNHLGCRSAFPINRSASDI